MKPFRILFITQEDPFYVRVFFEEFFRDYVPIEEVKGVVIAPTMGKKSQRALIKQMIDFYGLWDFCRMGLKFAWYKAGAKISEWIPVNKFYSIAQISRRYQVPVYYSSNINSEPFLKFIQSLDLDLIISVAAPQIFKEKLICLPGNGCINIHNSKLPKYRGMLPNFWQMMMGEKSVGTTIHRINAGIDDGEIFLQRETPVFPGETLDSVICRTKRLGAKMMIEAIKGIREGTLLPLPNRSEEASYYSFPTRRDVKEFRKRGFRLI